MDLINSEKDKEELKAIVNKYRIGHSKYKWNDGLIRFNRNYKIFLICFTKNSIFFTVHNRHNVGIAFVSDILYSLTDFDNLIFYYIQKFHR